MNAAEVPAELVEAAEAARDAALREWHIKFRAGQQTEPGHVLGMRAALAAVLPEVQARALDEASRDILRSLSTGGIGSPANWLHHRAARLRAESGEGA